jgi:hypothetical protein
MMRRLATLSLLALLGGCATGPSFEQRMSALIGLPEGDVVARLGVPTRVHETEGRRFLEFEQRRSVPVPIAPYPMGWRRPYFGPEYGYQVVGCDVTFEMQDGRARGYSARGDGCA